MINDTIPAYTTLAPTLRMSMTLTGDEGTLVLATDEATLALLMGTMLQGPAGPVGPQGDQGSAGPVGPQGIPGALGGDKYYTHYQDIASTSWLITHDLAKRPAVTVIDSAGDSVEGGVQYLSDSQLVLTFSAPFSGTAYLN